MIKALKKLLLPLAVLIIAGFILFLINQISGVYLLVRSNSVTAANILLAVLIIGALALVLWPLILYLKLPRPLTAPKYQSELEPYRKRLMNRLKSNSILQRNGIVPTNEDSLHQALQLLHKEADSEIRKTANAVFLTTAVSQNGKLDAFTILATQSRMVWKIAHIYYQRPTLRELVYLYANVGASSLLATEIEELDISQQVEPVIRSFFQNSAGKSIPLLGPTTNIILDSLLEGSTNAFLTLRVGVIAKRYCGCNEVAVRSEIRKSAFKEASILLKDIVLRSSGQIISGLLKASRKAGVDTLKSGWEGIKSAGGKVAGGITRAGRQINPFGKKDPDRPTHG